MQIDKYGNDVGYEKTLQDIKIDMEKSQKHIEMQNF